MTTAATDATVPMRRRIGLIVRVIGKADRTLVVLILVTLVLTAVAGSMQSLALKWIVDASVEQRWTFALIACALGGVAAGLIGAAGRAGSEMERVVANETGVRIDRDTLDLTASIPGIEHLENPDYLDRLELVRGNGSALMAAAFTVARAGSLALSLATAVWLLATVHPVLALTPLFAIPTTILVPRSERHVDAARARAAERQRAATQLHNLYLDPDAAMELRVFGAEDHLDHRADQLWRDVSNIHLAGSIRGALVSSLGWLSLTTGYVLALLITANLALRGDATVGDVVLVSQLALLIRGNVAQTAEAARRAAAAFKTADRFLWLEDLHATTQQHQNTTNAPTQLSTGIRFDDVTFTYPGTDNTALANVSFELDAGSVVALVGDNGAGKTTIVKLLTAMYQPTSGHIAIDDVDLNDIDPTQWRKRLTGTFQDYLRLETTARTSIGIGDVEQLNDTARITTAAARGGAGPVLEQLPDGLDTPLGKTYHDGQELSGGQWQRIAISRGLIPHNPLVRILDEPTAALDPAAEHDTYQRYLHDDTDLAPGAITILVTHRFSSVPDADLIIVLNNGHITELGNHTKLLTHNGHYAHMYRKQADAYR